MKDVYLGRSSLIKVATVPISLNILLKGQLRFLNQYYAITAIASPGEDMNVVERREEVRCVAIAIERKISLLSDLKSLLQLYLFFKKEKPLIVHSITPKGGLLSMIAAKMAGVPIRMHTFTGLIFPSKKGFIQSLLIIMDKLLCYCATNIYPEGRGVQQDLINFKITSKPLKIIANGNINGIDLDFFSRKNISNTNCVDLKKQLGISEADFVFIFVGRLVGDKGINEAVTAFLLLQEKKTNIKLLLVGPMESKDPLAPVTISEITNNLNIKAVGFQEDVRPYFAISNVLLFPSYREGFPNVVMQAGAMGLPSIVTNINGSNEIIMDKENGIVVPVKDTVALFDAMDELIENKNLLQVLKENARDKIESRYSQKLVWESLLEEYKSLEKNV